MQSWDADRLSSETIQGCLWVVQMAPLIVQLQKKTLKPIIKSYIQVPAMATDCLHTHRLSQHSTEQIRRFTRWLIWLPEWIKHLSHHSSPACHTEHWQLSPLNTNKAYRIWVLFLDFVYFKSNMIHMSGTSSRVLSLSNTDKRSITLVVWKESAHFVELKRKLAKVSDWTQVLLIRLHTAMQATKSCFQ